MSCPHLEYRRRDDAHEFDHDRPFCALAATFVSPMQADVCNDRHTFSHRTHCDIYRDHGARPNGEAATTEQSP